MFYRRIQSKVDPVDKKGINSVFFETLDKSIK